jgi:glutathione S-transferase
MLGYGTYEDMVATLERAITDRDWFCGARFTAVDVYVGAQIDWGLQFGTLPERPAFSAYAGRLRQRPAYARAKAIDNALIAAMPQRPD